MLAKDRSAVGRNLPIGVPAAPPSPARGMSGAQARQAVAPAVEAQERDFKKAVQPDSPISDLLSCVLGWKASRRRLTPYPPDLHASPWSWPHNRLAHETVCPSCGALLLTARALAVLCAGRSGTTRTAKARHSHGTMKTTRMRLNSMRTPGLAKSHALQAVPISVAKRGRPCESGL